MKMRGSAMLITVLIISALIFGTTVLWRSVSMSLEGAMHRYRSKKIFYATESLAMYGIAMIKSGLVRLDELKINKDVLIYQGAWPKQTKIFGKLFVKKHISKAVFELKALLFDANEVHPAIVTSVVCKAGPPIKVIAWST